MRPNGIITLITDFGVSDSYVGVMKGVILGIAPSARLVDITHDIRSQDVQHGAYIIATATPHFPVGTIHVVVVDPGVGSARRAIAFATLEAFFVGPDNGVLTSAWQDAGARHGESVAAVELAEPRFWRAAVSSTFHGRDIFAPVAAHLANGTPLAALGPPIATLHEAAVTPPHLSAEGMLTGRIINIDHFGNCITNITPQHLAQLGPDAHVVISVGAARITGVQPTFAAVPVGELLAYMGSDNFLEVALRNGDAARALGVAVDTRVAVWKV